MIIWITGLSGSGKTTVGEEVYKQWSKIEPKTVLVDNDETRKYFDYGILKKHSQKTAATPRQKGCFALNDLYQRFFI